MVFQSFTIPIQFLIIFGIICNRVSQVAEAVDILDNVWAQIGYTSNLISLIRKKLLQKTDKPLLTTLLCQRFVKPLQSNTVASMSNSIFIEMQINHALERLTYLTLDRPSGGLLCALIAAVLAALRQGEQFARFAQPGNRPQRGGHRWDVRRVSGGDTAVRHHLQLIGFDVVVQVVAEETCAS